MEDILPDKPKGIEDIAQWWRDGIQGDREADGSISPEKADAIIALTGNIIEAIEKKLYSRERLLTSLQNATDELIQGQDEAPTSERLTGLSRAAFGRLREVLGQMNQEAHDLRSIIQDDTTRDIPDRWPLKKIAGARGVSPSTISIYIGQIRAEDADKPEAERRIKTPKGGHLTDAEYQHLCKFIDTKTPRPKARRKPTRKRRV